MSRSVLNYMSQRKGDGLHERLVELRLSPLAHPGLAQLLQRMSVSPDVSRPRRSGAPQLLDVPDLEKRRGYPLTLSHTESNRRTTQIDLVLCAITVRKNSLWRLRDNDRNNIGVVELFQVNLPKAVAAETMDRAPAGSDAAISVVNPHINCNENGSANPS